MRLRVLVTGGTFDKDYDEIAGELYFKDTHLVEMLRLGRCRHFRWDEVRKNRDAGVFEPIR